MKKRIITVAAIACLLLVGLSGAASARSTLTVVVASEPVGVRYDSNGTFDSVTGTVDQACAAVGQQDASVDARTGASVCIPRSHDPADGSSLASVATPAVGWGSDGFFDGFKNICAATEVVGIPAEGHVVEVVPGIVVVAVCA